MQLSKDSIIKGLANYTASEVVGVISDSNLKFIITATIAAIQVNPKIADKFFNNEAVKYVLLENNGEYDIDYAEQILEKTVKECGEIKIEIPAIPFILPNSQELTFKSNDIEKLFKSIRGN